MEELGQSRNCERSHGRTCIRCGGCVVGRGICFPRREPSWRGQRWVLESERLTIETKRYGSPEMLHATIMLTEVTTRF